MEGKNIRDSKGRFVRGHTPLNPRDKDTGKFIKKEKFPGISPVDASMDNGCRMYKKKSTDILTVEEKTDKIIYEAIKRKRENIYEYIWGD